jgi:hypothetical protein
LPGLKFYATAKWRSLTPLVSSLSDVREVLGDPSNATDLAHYFDPYPGDASAESPLLTYPAGSDWEIFVYFGKKCGYSLGSKERPRNTLCSVELIPRKRRPFKSVVFPAAFAREKVSGADAAWDQYRDSYGLAYEVYTTRTPYGKTIPGDLNRIVYGPSDADLQRFDLTRRKPLF